MRIRDILLLPFAILSLFILGMIFVSRSPKKIKEVNS